MLENAVDFLNILKQVPVYVWVIIAVIALVLFGDRKKWDRIARFPGHGVRGRNRSTPKNGYIEVDCYKKKGMIITIELSIDDQYSKQPAEIYINNKLALTIPASKTKWGIIRHKGKYNLTEPDLGEITEVKSSGQTILSSTFD